MNEWISVKDEMPPPEEVQIYKDFVISRKVLVFNTHEGIKSDFAINDMWSSFNTHWMPLPQPPVTD
jgi:hypothetical protein